MVGEKEGEGAGRMSGTKVWHIHCKHVQQSMHERLLSWLPSWVPSIPVVRLLHLA